MASQGTRFCALGCPPSKNYFLFPDRQMDEARRKLWLDFFDMEEPFQKQVYACERHFSQQQIVNNGIKKDAVPDIPVVNNSSNQPPFRRKIRDLRKNVIVVTPRDPEFIIYRNQTGVFHQNLFNNGNSTISAPPPLQPRPLLQMPIIKSVSCSVATQTCTRLCGSVQVSDFLDEFRLNCFYCSETFALQNWSEFVKHLKAQHFEQEEAFKRSKFLCQDHDYTPLHSPPPLPTITKRINSHILAELPVIMAPPMIIDLTKEDNTLKPTPPPAAPLPSPPPLTPKPATTTESSNKKPVNLNLANKLIKLLDETVLNPDFRRTEEDNIVVIKRKVVETLQSNFLSKIIAEEVKSTPSASTSDSVVANKKPQTTISSMSVPKFTRPLYTLSYGQQNVVSVRNTPKIALRKFVKKRRPTISETAPPPIENFEAPIEETPISSLLADSNLQKRSKSFAKRIAKQAIKNITNFENVYQTVKTRAPKVPSTGIFYVKDINSNKVTEMQTSNKTPLSRCLRRTSGTESVYTPVSIETLQQNPTELAFEYSPEDVINSLLDNMRYFPILWEFHDYPYDPTYAAAISELCKLINAEWLLNISPLKMRSSVNRILKFYRYMLPCENIEMFADYFDKCTLFLPSSVEEIPRARCLHCYICYKKDSELRQHLIEKHEFLKWPYKCDHCPERFLKVEDYELHKSLPHYVEIFKCEQCNKRFNRRYLYNKHKSSHERTMRRRSGVTLEEAENAVKIVNTEKHVCDICQKEFSRASYLSYHKIFHGEKKFKCHLCPKAFFIKSNLKLHIMKHKNEMNYMCEVCGKGFVRASHLSRHMYTHSGEKVACNICNVKIRKSSMSRHRRIMHLALEGDIESIQKAKRHHLIKFRKPKVIKNRTKESVPRQYNCKVCLLPFERLKYLKEHNKQMHNNGERISCKICLFTFRYKQNLKAHYREKHKLHPYQVFKLVDHDEQLEVVLAMTPAELDALSQGTQHVLETKTEVVDEEEEMSAEPSAGINYFEQDKIHSAALQDEIMKAVENIDKQEIKIDDEHSMHEFFNDLLKN